MQLDFELILAACWIVFIGYWIYSAPKSKRTLNRNFGTGMLIRVGIFAVIVALASINSKFHLQVQMQAHVGLWWGVVGCACAVAGIGIAVWARYYLGRNWGMPMSIKENAELVTGGPYQWVRNPIYSGMLLAILGSVIVAGVWWLVVLIGAGIYFVFSVFQEEKDMQKAFPNSYPAYKARTWRLVPFIF